MHSAICSLCFLVVKCNMGFKESDHNFQYFENTRYSHPHVPTVIAAQMVTQRPAVALDLGCGALPDSRALVEMGFHTLAVDADPLVERYARDLKGSLFSLQICAFNELVIPDASIDLVSSMFTLQFIPKNEAAALAEHVGCWLKLGGIFTANFLGEHDEWNTGYADGLTFYQQPEIESLLLIAGLESLDLRGRESFAPTASGKLKKWHLYETIARKPC